MTRFLLLAALLIAPTPLAAHQDQGAAELVAGQAAAPDTALERKTRELASELRCPVCQGLSIQDSPTELAVDMKAVVREQLASGRSPDEVRAYFIEKYGEWVLLEPKAEGFNLTVYLLPLLTLVLGAGVVVRGIRRWTRNAPQGMAEEPDPEF